MSSETADNVNQRRRRVLTATATVVGGVGLGFAAAPFLVSWSPSERAQAAGAPVEIDISKLEEGQRVTVEWRGKPVWAVRRTPGMLEALPTLDDRLRDPESVEPDQQPPYAQNEFRSIKPEYLILIGICTHLGCSPTFRPEFDPREPVSDWKGGFFCPCHGSAFDMAGRVYKAVPAPLNLVVPPHQYLSDSRILVGVDTEAT
jgi:ubiquinol-cytochrome c reductase iron-sulfur subunit